MYVTCRCQDYAVTCRSEKATDNCMKFCESNSDLDAESSDEAELSPLGSSDEAELSPLSNSDGTRSLCNCTNVTVSIIGDSSSDIEVDVGVQVMSKRFDIGDIVNGKINLKDLDRRRLLCYLKNHTIPQPSEVIKQVVVQGKHKVKTLTFQLSG